MPFLVLLVLLFVVQSDVGRLSVTVRSAGSPVAGAQVRAAGRMALTDSQGHAQLTVPAGTHEINASAEAFLEVKATVSVTPDATVEVEVELSPAVGRSEEVIVTAARSDRRLDDQPMRIEVVGRDDIEEKALMTPGSVAMLLGETTGLRVQTTSPALGAANVRIQGLRGRYSQLLSDGLPLYGLQGDSLSLLQVPPLDLGQVEIIKGAASALYGPSALGGVINLVSQKPLARHRELLLNQSTQEATDLAFWLIEPARRRWAFTMLGGMHGQAQQDVDGDGWADLPGFARGVFRPRFFWDDGKGRTFFGTVGVMAENRWGGTVAGASAPDGRPFDQDLDSRRIDGGIVMRLPAGPGRLLTIRSSLSYRSERRVFGDDIERGGRTTWLSEAVLLGKSGRHTWLAGGAVQQDAFRHEDLRAFNYTFTAPGLLAQDEIDLPAKMTLGASARIDRHSRYGLFASPRVSLLWKPVDGWNARLSAGTGFFAPTPFTEETEETGFSRLRVPRALVAEKARSLSFDSTWTRGHMEIVATGFASKVSHPVELRPYGAGAVELVNAEGPVRTWGGELLAQYRRPGLLVMATHGYTISREDDPEARGRRDVPLTPRNVTSFNAIWEGEKWGRAGFEWYYVSRQPLEENPYRHSGRGYMLYGLLFERRFGRVRLFANLENLGNIRQTRYDSLIRPARNWDGRWTVDAWAPLDGRVINGGIRFAY